MFGKVITGSIMSVALLASASPAFASTAEKPIQMNASITDSVFKPSATTVGYWNTSLSGNSKKDLDTIKFGTGSSFSIDGYQTAGSRGTPVITYRLYEKKSGSTRSSELWSATKTQNGYIYLTFPKSIIDANKEYYLEAENLTNFSVDLKGNAYKS
ncbi:hypothetical protein P8843_06910 [Bacillus inaquosorum]|uniref:hypothetical protein n=1 Tax=Bacillus TaxID=1386 RepID=UPI001CDC5AE1|nr:MULTISPECIES: hypothetical protein [Bacillus]MCY7977477.1 hypothetical protein [Bacillus inaquosorum]MEC0589958.1 hypothetical protein [Bacillus inaquosorum]